jgi:hypothetical protein
MSLFYQILQEITAEGDDADMLGTEGAQHKKTAAPMEDSGRKVYQC